MFWNSGNLTGSQTASQTAARKRRFWSSGNLTGSQTEQISELISTNKALSASNAVQIASDKKEILLAENNQEEKKRGFWARLFS